MQVIKNWFRPHYYNNASFFLLTLHHENMMKIFRSIGFILILLVFIFSTSGITFFQHVCQSSQKVQIAVYPELFDGQLSGCCTDEATGYSDTPVKTTAQVDASPCCISSRSYLRLLILTDRSKDQVFTLQPLLLFLGPGLIPEPRIDTRIFSQNVFFEFYSPPLSGRLLIHFLHQIKLPSSDHDPLS